MVALTPVGKKPNQFSAGHKTLNQRVQGSSPCAPTIEFAPRISARCWSLIEGASDAPGRRNRAGLAAQREQANNVLAKLELEMAKIAGGLRSTTIALSSLPRQHSSRWRIP